MGIFSSESKSKSKVTPYDEGQLRDMLSRLNTLGGTPMEMYPDQMFADMTPEQLQALDMRRDFAGGMEGMTAPAMDAWQSTLSAPDVANNPYVSGMLDQQAGLLNRNLAEMMPSIDANMLGVNERLGGSGQGVAQGIAARGTQDALARTAAETQLSAYGQGLDQQRYGLSAAPGMAQFGMMPADIMMGVGDVERAENQMGISEDMQRFNFAQQEPWQRLQNQASLFNPLSLPYASTETKSSSSPSALGVASSLGGMAIGAMGMPGMPWGGSGGGAYGGMPTQMAGAPGGYAGSLNPYGYQMPSSFVNPAQMFSGLS